VRTRQTAKACGATVLAALLGMAHDVAAELRTVALSSDPAPGTQLGVLLGKVDYAPPVINAGGAVGFEAVLSGVGVGAANDKALYYGTRGSFQLIAREGGAAPGLADTALYSDGFVDLHVTDAGNVSFANDTVDSGGQRTLFAGPATALVPVLRTNQPAPGGGFYGLYDDHSFSDSNQLIFRSEYSASNPPMTTYVGTPGAIQVLWRHGGPAPAVGATAPFLH
jgi:hypothetical protein